MINAVSICAPIDGKNVGRVASKWADLAEVDGW